MSLKQQVLKLDSGGGLHNFVNTLKTPELHPFKVNFILQELHLNLKQKKKTKNVW